MIKAGDTVRLNSGGPMMFVVFARENIEGV